MPISAQRGSHAASSCANRKQALKSAQGSFLSRQRQAGKLNGFAHAGFSRSVHLPLDGPQLMLHDVACGAGGIVDRGDRLAGRPAVDHSIFNRTVGGHDSPVLSEEMVIGNRVKVGPGERLNVIDDCFNQLTVCDQLPLPQHEPFACNGGENGETGNQ